MPYSDPPDEVKAAIRSWDISLDSARVAVMPIKTDDKTAGGIIIPTTAQGHNFKSGYVLSAGPEAVQALWNADHTEAVQYHLKPGDRVHWGKYAGAVTDRHEKGETNMLIMNGQSGEGDVLGVLSHGR